MGFAETSGWITTVLIALAAAVSWFFSIGQLVADKPLEQIVTWAVIAIVLSVIVVRRLVAQRHSDEKDSDSSTRT